VSPAKDQSDPVRPRRRPGFFALAFILGVSVELPALLTIAHLTGQRWLAVVIALWTVLPSRTVLRNPWEQRQASPLQMYFLLWPFFAWWTMCAIFLVLAPLALLLRRVLAALPGLPPAVGQALTFDRALLGAGAVAVLLGLRALGRRPKIRRHTIAIAGLPSVFAGYTIAQISDLHCGPFTPGAQISRWVRRVNRLGADLVAVTGDLITSGAGYITTVAAALADLRAPDGAVACMGNHDYFTDGDAFAIELERQGLRLLRNRGHVIERPGGRLHIAGVDDTWTQRDDLERALRGRPPGAPTVLLAHDPSLFPAAAANGVALTLAGHTHGGQLASPVAPSRWNLARLVTPFTAGVYHIGKAALYVNRGLGTTGPPIRLGVRPEITLITLAPAGDDLAERLSHLAEDVIRDASEAR
jgi:predicted MPP superfamily phosphohydrolase